MKTYNRICIKDFYVSDQAKTFVIYRSHEYLTSEEKNGFVVVFGKSWVWVPVEYFAGEKVFTKS